MKTRSIVLFGMIGFAMSAFADAPPASLREAINDAVRLNPVTVSTDEFLESVHYSTLGAQAALYPTGQLSCSANFGNTTTSFSSGFDSNSTTSSYSCGVSASVNIYDGGAGRARLHAARAGEEATRAAYNTADSLIPNTRGSLAYNAMNSFVQLVQIREQLQFARSVSGFLDKFKLFSQDATLLSAITDVATTIQQLVDAESMIREDFKYYVTLEPADTLDNMDATIATLQIPASASDAIDLALASGPGVHRRTAEVEMARWNLAAIRAQYGPHVSLDTGVSRGSFNSQQSPLANSRSTNAFVGVRVSIPLSPAAHFEIQAANARLRASESQLEAARSSARHSITSLYQSLENSRRTYVVLNQNYTDQLTVVQGIVAQIDHHNTGGLDITRMLSAVNTLSSRHQQLSNVQERIVNGLFSIQQVTGLLFTDTLRESMQ